MLTGGIRSSQIRPRRNSGISSLKHRFEGSEGDDRQDRYSAIHKRRRIPWRATFLPSLRGCRRRRVRGLGRHGRSAT
jgi:hypothetical protein